MIEISKKNVSCDKAGHFLHETDMKQTKNFATWCRHFGGQKVVKNATPPRIKGRAIFRPPPPFFVARPHCFPLNVAVGVYFYTLGTKMTAPGGEILHYLLEISFSITCNKQKCGYF